MVHDQLTRVHTVMCVCIDGGTGPNGVSVSKHMLLHSMILRESGSVLTEKS